jgi:hypothetical protein
VCICVPVILAIKRLRQEDLEFIVLLSYMVSSRLARDRYETISKQNKAKANKAKIVFFDSGFRQMVTPVKVVTATIR